ncbi:MAG: hypothetical protein WCK42_06975 [Myxococcaceae bacterium]
MTSRNPVFFVLFFILLTSQSALSYYNDSRAKNIFWSSSIFTLATAAPVLALSGILSSMITMASDNVNQTPAMTPEQNQTILYQSKTFKTVLNTASAATGIAVLEILVPIGAFATNLLDQRKESAALSIFYLVPAILNTGMMGWALQSTKNLCDSQTACWEPPACIQNQTCGNAGSYNGATVAWGVLRGVSFIVPIVSISAALAYVKI